MGIEKWGSAKKMQGFEVMELIILLFLVMSFSYFSFLMNKPRKHLGRVDQRLLIQLSSSKLIWVLLVRHFQASLIPHGDYSTETSCSSWFPALTFLPWLVTLTPHRDVGVQFLLHSPAAWRVFGRRQDANWWIHPANCCLVWIRSSFPHSADVQRYWVMLLWIFCDPGRGTVSPNIPVLENHLQKKTQKTKSGELWIGLFSVALPLCQGSFTPVLPSPSPSDPHKLLWGFFWERREETMLEGGCEVHQVSAHPSPTAGVVEFSR